MKSVSRSMSKSLSGQKTTARAPETVSVGATRKGSPSMVLPGDGGVSVAPGEMNGPQANRSACHYADPMKRFGG